LSSIIQTQIYKRSMKFANEYPLFRLLISFIFGILTGHALKTITIPLPIIISLFTLLIIWIFRPIILRKFSWRYISGYAIGLLFFLMGIQLLWVKTDSHLSNHYSKLDSVSHYVVYINTPLIERKNSYKTVVNVKAAYQIHDTIPKKVSGKIILYFDKECRPTLNYGDELLIANNLQSISGLGNPNEFDYANYLRQQNISHSMYLIRTDWLKTHHSSPNVIIQLSLYVRNALLKILEDFNFNEPEFAVASAILLGYDEYIDQDLRQLYAGSGAMHILCVSGLHVGIIFIIFNTLLKFIKKYTYGDIIHSIILLFIIWSYALITGLSPSVFRAATMFSFITFGGIMNRKTSVYNSLAASAFVLLIYNPFLLFHIGFQLSYLAVLSILIFQPRLSALVKCRTWLGITIRDLVAVSIAAQLGTFPLAIYYFHQFPIYFILTNIIVIPLSFLVLTSGFANIFVYLIGSGSSYLGMLLTKGLYFTLQILNYSLELINAIPFAVRRDLFFTASDTLLIYLIIVFASLALIYKRAVYIFLLLGTFIILMISNSWERFGVNQQSELVIYNIPKHSLINIIEGNQSYLFCDSSLKAKTYEIDKYTLDYQLNNRIKNKYIIRIDSVQNSIEAPFITGNNVIYFQGKSFLILDERQLIPLLKKENHFNYLLIRNNPKLSMFTIDSLVSFDTLILDASNNYWNTRKWKRQSDSLDINYWDIKEKGAFFLKRSNNKSSD